MVGRLPSRCVGLGATPSPEDKVHLLGEGVKCAQVFCLLAQLCAVAPAVGLETCPLLSSSAVSRRHIFAPG